MTARKGATAPRRLANKTDRPHELRLTMSHAERLALGKLSERTGLSYSDVIRQAVRKMAEETT